ncbi:hypothetical protein PCANC_16186 [Puccinia coronata f. sp. avenae]|uniref:Uncharacterized protein n=1 Tax=Puccinia coronata f. sp. avenae TaxID=200324 RepID=A0A2N5UFA5_9BASI|nr:hypothetical protein PCANC_16186 [Puccinia coronata f. sp. avenae]
MTDSSGMDEDDKDPKEEGLYSGTPFGRAHAYPHAQKKRRADAARRFGKARAGFARLSAHISLLIQEAYVSQSTLIRVPKYPYKGTKVPL